MSGFEVSEPILNTPFDEPGHFWFIKEGAMAEKKPGRRPSVVYPPSDTRSPWTVDGKILQPSKDYAPGYEMVLVNTIRERVKSWRDQKYPGVSRTTRELLEWWRRDGRKWRLFYAQLEAAETVIFLKEARADFRQGLDIPLDMPSENQAAAGIKPFLRYALKMATGSGKTTVMGMLAAWSILNKINDRGNAAFSDIVLVMCPSVTIRYRLAELDPEQGEASIYRTRDLVPPHLMPALSQGKVLVKNWHEFEVKEMQSLNDGAKVIKSGVPETKIETIHISEKTTTARGRRYLSLSDYQRQVSAGLLQVVPDGHEYDRDGSLARVKVQTTRYVESDAAWVQRVLGRDIGGKENMLVFNDEAHHAYRIRREADEEEEGSLFGEDETAEEFFQEATVWIDGLDRINKMRSINFCVDLSATPYFLGRVGLDTNKPFPWVVSDFPLTDAIEAGLVKVPQFPLRGPSGEERAKYFNLWKWILEDQLTPGERGAQKASPNPEAILKYAHTPIEILAEQWEQTRQEWEKNEDDDRPPVFIIVCKNTRIAKVIYNWIANDVRPSGIPSLAIPCLHNANGVVNTVRIDSKVIDETETEGSKSDEVQWMRLTLDTVGKRNWPADRQGMPLYPPGFEELAGRMGRSLMPPGRDIRCIVSVGMLTEGWDCSTVTHIIGIRPFMSQLLCEQVVGRGLRRSSYTDFREDGRLNEEIARILGVPFEVVPYKTDPQGPPPPPQPKHHVHAIPEKSQYEITFPRVEGYVQIVKNAITVNWDEVPVLRLDPMNIPPEVQMKATLPSNEGHPSLNGPGATEVLSLNPFREKRREQELIFALSREMVREFNAGNKNGIPPHVLFPQCLNIVARYLREKVQPIAPAQKIDVFLSPYYGYAIESLLNALRPDTSRDEKPEVPRYEQHRGPGSTSDVDLWTTREVRPVERSHLNYIVADTKYWEQSAAYYIDTHPAVYAFVKNAGLGFSIPYIHNGQPHEYVPDFIIKLKESGKDGRFLIIETKGFDELEEIKKAAAERWIRAVNADGQYGQWAYAVAKNPSEVQGILHEFTEV